MPENVTSKIEFVTNETVFHSSQTQFHEFVTNGILHKLMSMGRARINFRKFKALYKKNRVFKKL